MINKFTLSSLVSTRRSTGVAVLSTWAVLALLLYFFFYLPSQETLVASIVRKIGESGSRKGMTPLESTKATEKMIRRAASNRTLGLDSIQFLNLPHRHDRFDSAALQSYLSDIDINNFPAVTEADIKDQGLPPTSRPGVLKPGEIGCWRAHANVWQYQLRNRIPALLVLESDAAWDVNLREQMGVLNKPFRELLVEDNPEYFRSRAGQPSPPSDGRLEAKDRTHPKALPQGGAASAADEDSRSEPMLPGDPDDPWAARSGLWDILTVGHCFDSRDPEKSSYRVYDDPWGPDSGFRFNDLDWLKGPLKRQRVVFRAQGMVCTTGYLISLRGAAKLLTRTHFNLDEPVDLVMNNMAISGELTVYSVQQRIVAQWVYREGLGMKERGAQSDIHNEVSNDSGSWDMGGWEAAWRTKDVYDYKWSYGDTGFANFALQKAWGTIWSDKWDTTRPS